MEVKPHTRWVLKSNERTKGLFVVVLDVITVIGASDFTEVVSFLTFGREAEVNGRFVVHEALDSFCDRFQRVAHDFDLKLDGE